MPDPARPEVDGAGAAPARGDGALFDALLLSQVRLGIVTVLLARAEATFPELKDILGLTQGNLGIHLRKLEDGGYVEVRKEFVDRRPRTTARLTTAGRRALLAHVAQLDRLVRG
jgi:DNA-binding MarR family transcriptional regulator